MDTGFPFDVLKPWGNFRQFNKNEPSTVKIITVNSNEVLSLQSHSKRSEFWRVIGGRGFVDIDGVRSEVKEGDEFAISVGSKHRMGASDGGLQVLEISAGEFDEDDIIRYEDKYGRA